MKVIYSEKQVAEQGVQSFDKEIIHSPSARKPKEVAEALKKFTNIEFVEPNPITVDDIKLCHNEKYVDDIINLIKPNGFGTISKEIIDSLMYTNGAMYDAAKLCTVNSPTCALVSGFHHAGYDRWKGLGYFCTFNGLMITAAKLIQDDPNTKVAIIDCDMHWGNGTDDILEELLQFKDSIVHMSFGKTFHHRTDAQKYLDFLRPNGLVEKFLEEFKPDVILYQAGADTHINDPYGGLLTTEEMYERDKLMFEITKKLNSKIAWNLAGGYQVDPDGSINKVIDLHLNTFRACQEVYNCF